VWEATCLYERIGCIIDMTYDFEVLFVNLLEQLSHDSLNMFLFGFLVHMDETQRAATRGQGKQCIKFTSNDGGQSLSMERGACERREFRSLCEWIKGGVESVTMIQGWSWLHEKLEKA